MFNVVVQKNQLIGGIHTEWDNVQARIVCGAWSRAAIGTLGSKRGILDNSSSLCDTLNCCRISLLTRIFSIRLGKSFCLLPTQIIIIQTKWCSTPLIDSFQMIWAGEIYLTWWLDINSSFLLCFHCLID